jgi:hypothetical protein
MIFLLASCSTTTHELNELTPEEIDKGWVLLFDGKTLDGWKGYNKELNGWKVHKGTLMSEGIGPSNGGGDIMTVKEYDNFELSVEWKISKQGNSGIIYLIHETPEYNQTYSTGPEYQVLDDLGWPDKLNELNLTASNYDMHAAVGKDVKPAMEWNTARIIKDKDQVEHWLNGKKVVEYTLWDEAWEESVQNCKWKNYPGYGQYKKGHISLQDHDTKVWYRNVKIRELYKIDEAYEIIKIY